MKRWVNWAVLAMFGWAAVSCQSSQGGLSYESQGDSLTVVHITQPTKYLLLPIQESCNESKVKLVTGSPADMAMDVRLAVDSIDYYVPFELPQGDSNATVTIAGIGQDAICWDSIKLSDKFDVTNTDYYRPIYHHTPLYGWMNDPNGMVYKDGEYHLYYQYNPYGSRWGNMHWGHSVSKDLIHWEHLKPAIARDTLGHIFSGSAVVDKNNTAGYGKDAIIALYTSASDEHGQIQCLAYSTDNGRTYTKYEHNPVLTPFDGLKDFRDPKVFWFEPAGKWYMIVSADKEMRFYESSNLKDWSYLSAFGQGYGVQPNQFECPDFIQLPVNGDPNNKKWVMIVNINPGCLFGGSATEYFVGDFDGKTFKCDTDKEVTKWLDWGKDNYATVTWSNAPAGRCIALGWMSNWQYANNVPTTQYRSANTLARDLTLYRVGGELYLRSKPSPEIKKARAEEKKIPTFEVKGNYEVASLLADNKGAYEIEMTIENKGTSKIDFSLMNEKGEKVAMYYDVVRKQFVMDRSASGIVGFSRDFPAVTVAPVRNTDQIHLRLFIDRSSVEAFGEDGEYVMTNLVFPAEPYNRMVFSSDKGSYIVKSMNVYRLQ